MVRTFKTHARACGPAGTGWVSACGTPGHTGEEVTCLRCLYLTGRYVPLSKLEEHQHAEALKPVTDMWMHPLVKLLTLTPISERLYANDQRKHEPARISTLVLRAKPSTFKTASVRSAPLYSPICPHCGGSGKARIHE